MGIYINPEECTKEAWLQSYGARIATPPENIHKMAEDEWIVCLVDNALFTAAAVMYSQDELEAFSWGGDPRPKEWYIVLEDDLKAVLGEEVFANARDLRSRRIATR